MPLALGVLLASLIGSVHCAAMCGAFTCLYNDPNASRAISIRRHLGYNGGRLIAYLTLGAIAGAFGSAINQAAGATRIAAFVAGGLMILWGIDGILAARGTSLVHAPVPAGWRRAMGSAVQHVMRRPPMTRAIATGLFTALLPCGWLYVFVVAAGATGSPLKSAGIMAVFWAGTLPMMLAVGAGAQRLLGRFRNQLPVVSAATVLLLGVLSIVFHLRGASLPHWLHASLPGTSHVP